MEVAKQFWSAVSLFQVSFVIYSRAWKVIFFNFIGEPTKAARVFRLFSKRRNNKRIRKSPEDEDFVVREVPLLHNGGHDNNGVSAGSNEADVIVQVTIETAANGTDEAKELIQEVA